jgi:hypothetical protein
MCDLGTSFLSINATVGSASKTGLLQAAVHVPQYATHTSHVINQTARGRLVDAACRGTSPAAQVQLRRLPGLTMNPVDRQLSSLDHTPFLFLP